VTEKSISLFDCGVSNQWEASNLHDRVQNLYEQVEQPEVEGAYMELTKEWNSQKTWNPMHGEEEQEEFISGDENGMSSVGEKPEIWTIQDKKTGQKVVVKNETITVTESTQVEHEGVDKSADIDETPIIKPTQEEQKGMSDNDDIDEYWHVSDASWAHCIRMQKQKNFKKGKVEFSIYKDARFVQ